MYIKLYISRQGEFYYCHCNPPMFYTLVCEGGTPGEHIRGAAPLFCCWVLLPGLSGNTNDVTAICKGEFSTIATKCNQ